MNVDFLSLLINANKEFLNLDDFLTRNVRSIGHKTVSRMSGMQATNVKGLLIGSHMAGIYSIDRLIEGIIKAYNDPVLIVEAVYSYFIIYRIKISLDYRKLNLDQRRAIFETFKERGLEKYFKDYSENSNMPHSLTFDFDKASTEEYISFYSALRYALGHDRENIVNVQKGGVCRVIANEQYFDTVLKRSLRTYGLSLEDVTAISGVKDSRLKRIRLTLDIIELRLLFLLVFPWYLNRPSLKGALEVKSLLERTDVKFSFDIRDDRAFRVIKEHATIGPIVEKILNLKNESFKSFFGIIYYNETGVGTGREVKRLLIKEFLNPIINSCIGK